MKFCSRCEIEKDETLFHKDRSSKDGLFCYCADCACKYKRDRLAEKFKGNMEREWGSAHSIFHKGLFRRLIWECAGQIEFEQIKEWDGKALLFAKVFGCRLPPGYHGVQDIIYEDGKVRFRADADV